VPSRNQPNSLTRNVTSSFLVFPRVSGVCHWANTMTGVVRALRWPSEMTYNHANEFASSDSGVRRGFRPTREVSIFRKMNCSKSGISFLRIQMCSSLTGRQPACWTAERDALDWLRPCVASSPRFTASDMFTNIEVEFPATPIISTARLRLSRFL
jgi:hypothetical protein